MLRDAFVPAQILDDAVRVGARLFAGVPFMFDRLVALVRDGWPLAGHAADDDLGRRAARSRDGPRLRRAHRPPHPLALRDQRDGRHRLRHRARSRRRAWRWAGRCPGSRSRSGRTTAAVPGTGRIHVTRAGGLERLRRRGRRCGLRRRRLPHRDLGAIGGDGRLRLKGRLSAFVNVRDARCSRTKSKTCCGRTRWSRTRACSACPTCAGVSRSRHASSRRDGRLGVVALRAFCANRLAAHKIPRLLVLLPELPRDERGKVSRQALEDLVAAERIQGIP